MVLDARDQAAAVLRDIERTVRDLTKAMAAAAEDSQRLALGLTVAAGGLLTVGLGAAAFLKASVDEAAAYEQALSLLITKGHETQETIGAIGERILALSRATGFAGTELAQAMIPLEQAGYSGADGLKVLTVAAMAAEATGEPVATAVGTIRTALASYNLTANDSTAVTDMMLAAIKEGAGSFGGLQSALSVIGPEAAAMRIPLKDLLAIIADMGRQGVSTSVATKSLQFMLQELQKPSAAAQEALSEIGLTQAQVANEISSKGLVPALQLIHEHLTQKFPQGGAAANQVMAMLFGNVRGLAGAVDVLADSEGKLPEIENAITQSTQGTGETMKDWQIAQSNLNNQIREFNATIQSIAIYVGQALLPVLKGWLATLGPAIASMAEWVAQHKGSVAVIMSVAAAVGILGGVVLGLSAAVAVVTAAGAPVIAIIAAVIVVLGIVAALIVGVTSGWIDLGSAAKAAGNELEAAGKDIMAFFDNTGATILSFMARVLELLHMSADGLREEAQKLRDSASDLQEQASRDTKAADEAFQHFKENLSKPFTSDSLDSWKKKLEDTISGLTKGTEAANDFGAQVPPAFDAASDSAQQLADKTNDFVQALVQADPAIVAVNAEIASLQEQIAGLNAAIRANEDQLRGAQAEYQRMSDQLSNLQERLSAAQEKLREFEHPTFTGSTELARHIAVVQDLLNRIDISQSMILPLDEVLKRYPILVEGAEAYMQTLPLTREGLQATLDQLKKMQEVQVGEAQSAFEEAIKGPQAEVTLDQAIQQYRQQSQVVSSLTAEVERQQQAMKAQESVIRSIQAAGEALNRTLQAMQEQLRETQEKQRAMSDALSLVFDWLLKGRAEFEKLGPAGEQAASLIDMKMGELMKSVEGAATGTTQTTAKDIDDATGRVKGYIASAYGSISGYIAQLRSIPPVVTTDIITRHIDEYFTSSIASIPGRQAGGPVTQGMAYIVGESGPELFVPPVSGNIVPHGAAVSAGPSVVIDLRGSQVMSDADLDKLVDRIGQRIAQVHLPSAGVQLWR